MNQEPTVQNDLQGQSGATDSSKKEESQEKAKGKKEKITTDDRGKVKSGMLVRVFEKVVDVTQKGEPREHLQVFKGMVLARKHGAEAGATITVQKESEGVMVEKIFPIHSPLIDRIVIDKEFKTRRSKLYFLREPKQRLRKEI